MYLIDRDGTILSTSNDSEELEPIIKKALNIDWDMNRSLGLEKVIIFSDSNFLTLRKE